MPFTQFPDNPADYSRRILVTTSDFSLSTMTDVLHRTYKHSSSGFPTELWILNNDIVSDRYPTDANFYLTISSTKKIKVVQKYVKQDAETTATQNDQIPPQRPSTADNIQNILATLSADMGSTIHLLINENSSALSYLTGHIMSLFGRKQDRISIVSQTPEHNHGLSHAVNITNIPFVRLSHLFRGTAQVPTNFDEAVTAVNTALAPAPIRLHLQKKQLIIGKDTVKLSPASFSWFSWFVALRLENRLVRWTDDGIMDDFIKHYKCLYGTASPKYENIKRSVQRVDKDYFPLRNRILQKELFNALGHHANLYDIKGFGRRPQTRYGLSPDVEIILSD